MSQPIFDQKQGGFRVFVGNLGSRTNISDLQHECERYGPLVDCWVARNPPGFAFVLYKYGEDADSAVRNMDGRMVCGQRVRVEHAKARSENSRNAPTSGGYRGGGDDNYGSDRRHSRRRSRSRSNSRERTKKKSSRRRHSSRDSSRDSTPRRKHKSNSSDSDDSSGDRHKRRRRTKSKSKSKSKSPNDKKSDRSSPSSESNHSKGDTNIDTENKKTTGQNSDDEDGSKHSDQN